METKRRKVNSSNESKVSSSRKMETKRRKLNCSNELKVAGFTTTILNINMDCMFNIFDLLSTNDLCSLSETCTDLKKISGEYFYRKYPSKSIILGRNMKFKEESKDKATNCFRNYIRNMVVCRYGGDDFYEFLCDYPLGEDDKNLLESIPTYAGEYLKNISFKEVVFHNSFGSGSEMKNILEEIESIAFVSCTGEANYYTEILNNCQCIKKLAIHEYNNQKLHAVLTKTFPTLERIEFGGHVKTTEAFTKKLKTFLLLNQSIKAFTWHFTSGRATISDHTFFKMILDNVCNLEELYLSLDRYDNLPKICDELKVACERKNFKRLELQFYSYRAKKWLIQHGGGLTKLDVLKGLHFNFSIDYNSFMNVISPLEHLKILQLETVPYGRKWQNISVTKLINLEELIIDTLESRKFLQTFIGNSLKLKKVVIVKCAISLANFDIFSKKTFRLFNEERGKLEGACNMTIYSNDPQKSAIKVFPKDLNLVTIKCTKFQYHYIIFNANKQFIHWEIDSF